MMGFVAIDVTSIEEAAERLSPYRVIFVEGARSCGKSFTSKRISTILGRPCYSTFSDRKRYIVDTNRGVAQHPVLDITQATIFVMDFLRQVPCPVVCDRSYISSCVFQGINYDKLTIFKELLADCKGSLLYVDCSGHVLVDRLVRRYGNDKLLSYIMEERKRYEETLNALGVEITRYVKETVDA